MNLLLGIVLITMSSQVKLPSLLALGFVAMALACRWGGTFKAFLIAGGSLSAVSLAVMALIGWASGLGFGWLYTLGTANVVRSWMSLPTLLALGTGQVGILLGLGDHTTAVLGLTRAIGVLTIAIIVTFLLLAVLRGRLHPVGGLGVALGMTVLLFPVVQPWYVLWAVIPLAAWATLPQFRTTTIVVTLVVGIFGPTANGDRFTLFQILLAVVASTMIVLILIGPPATASVAQLPGRRRQRGGAPPRRTVNTGGAAQARRLRDFPDSRPDRTVPRASARVSKRTGQIPPSQNRPRRPRGGSARAAWPQRRWQDHHGGDVRGIHQARRGQHRDPRIGPRRRQRPRA
jgi:hypothetical protein